MNKMLELSNIKRPNLDEVELQHALWRVEDATRKRQLLWGAEIAFFLLCVALTVGLA